MHFGKALIIKLKVWNNKIFWVFLNDPYTLVFHVANKTKHNVVRYVSDASAIDWCLRRI